MSIPTGLFVRIHIATSEPIQSYSIVPFITHHYQRAGKIVDPVPNICADPTYLKGVQNYDLWLFKPSRKLLEWIELNKWDNKINLMNGEAFL